MHKCVPIESCLEIAIEIGFGFEYPVQFSISIPIAIPISISMPGNSCSRTEDLNRKFILAIAIRDYRAGTAGGQNKR